MSYQLLNQIRLYFKWRIFNFKKNGEHDSDEGKEFELRRGLQGHIGLRTVRKPIHPYKTNISDKKLI